MPGVDIRKTPVMTDSEPSREAVKGPEPQGGVWPEVAAPTPESERVAFEGEGQKIVEALEAMDKSKQGR